MHSEVRNMTEWRSHAAVIRDGTEEEKAVTAAPFPAARWKPKPSDPSPQQIFPDPDYTPFKQTIKWEEVRCHNCSGLGHSRRNCPSPKKPIRAQAPAGSPDTAELGRGAGHSSWALPSSDGAEKGRDVPPLHRL